MPASPALWASTVLTTATPKAASTLDLERVPGTGLRARVLEAVADATESLGFKPAVSFHGVVDRDIALPVQVKAAAILREALPNSARHARASRKGRRLRAVRLELLAVFRRSRL